MNPNRKHTGKYASHPGGQPGGQHPTDAASQMSHPTHQMTGETTTDKVLKGKSTANNVYEAQYGKKPKRSQLGNNPMSSSMPEGKVINVKKPRTVMLGP